MAAKQEWEMALSQYHNTDNQTFDRWLDVDEARRRYLALADARA